MEQIRATIVFTIHWFSVYIYFLPCTSIILIKNNTKNKKSKGKDSFYIPLVLMPLSQRNHADCLSEMSQSLFLSLKKLSSSLSCFYFSSLAVVSICNLEILFVYV